MPHLHFKIRCIQSNNAYCVYSYLYYVQMYFNLSILPQAELCISIWACLVFAPLPPPISDSNFASLLASPEFKLHYELRLKPLPCFRLSFPKTDPVFPQTQPIFPKSRANLPKDRINFPKRQATASFPKNYVTFPKTMADFPNNRGKFPEQSKHTIVCPHPWAIFPTSLVKINRGFSKANGNNFSKSLFLLPKSCQICSKPWRISPNFPPEISGGFPKELHQICAKSGNGFSEILSQFSACFPLPKPQCAYTKLQHEKNNILPSNLSGTSSAARHAVLAVKAFPRTKSKSCLWKGSQVFFDWFSINFPQIFSTFLTSLLWRACPNSQVPFSCCLLWFVSVLSAFTTHEWNVPWPLLSHCSRTRCMRDLRDKKSQ